MYPIGKDKQVINIAKDLAQGKEEQEAKEAKVKEVEDYLKNKRVRVNMNNTTVDDKKGISILIGLIMLVGSSIVEAQTPCGVDCVHGVDPYPWKRTGWHAFSRRMAYNIAFNFAVSECSDNGLIIDKDQITSTYSWVTIDDGYHLAHVSYYCKDRPPKISKKWIWEVWGPYNCDSGDALEKAEEEANRQCKLQLRPTGAWYLGNSEILSHEQLGSGECGFGSWGPNPTHRWKLLPQCFRNN